MMEGMWPLPHGGRTNDLQDDEREVPPTLDGLIDGVTSGYLVVEPGFAMDEEF